jgi:hypothetical protein
MAYPFTPQIDQSKRSFLLLPSHWGSKQRSNSVVMRSCNHKEKQDCIPLLCVARRVIFEANLNRLICYEVITRINGEL